MTDDASAEDTPPGAKARRTDFAWGLLDQAFASGTTFLLTLVAARQLGPAGVGAMALAFAAYQVGLGLQRALLLEPYLTRTTTWRMGDREALGATVVLAAVGAALAALLFALVGLAVGGTTGRAFLAFAPWIVPALIQVLLRTALFRHGLGSRAALASGLWLGGFVLGVAIGWRDSITALVAAWGLGAVLSLGLLFLVSDRPQVARPLAAVRWWRAEASHFGRWLVADVTGWSVCWYGLLSGLAAIAGTAAVGGYRVIDSLFSPLSLLAPALSNPGFKAVRDARLERPTRVFRLAVSLSGYAVVGTAAYAVVLGLGRDLIFDLYGDAFRTYASLIAPIALGHALLAGTIGFVILLKVFRQGRDIVIVGAGGAFGALLVGLPTCAAFGLTAAAWAIAAAFLPPLLWAGRTAWRTSRNNARTSRPPNTATPAEA